MANSDITIKAGGTYPPVSATLTDDAGTPIVLTNATSVHFAMKPLMGGLPAVDHVAVIVSAVAGTVRYDWQAGDTVTPGYYNAEFRINWSTGAVQPVPSDGYILVLVSVGLT